jgi:hypothetical protein
MGPLQPGAAPLRPCFLNAPLPLPALWAIGLKRHSVPTPSIVLCRHMEAMHLHFIDCPSRTGEGGSRGSSPKIRPKIKREKQTANYALSQTQERFIGIVSAVHAMLTIFYISDDNVIANKKDNQKMKDGTLQRKSHCGALLPIPTGSNIDQVPKI